MGKLQNIPQIALHLILVFFANFVLSQSVQAKCRIDSIEIEFDRADAVFSGTVTKKVDFTKKNSQKFTHKGSIFTFSVEESFKGERGETVEVQSLALTAESYIDFKKGEKYLVYAEKNSKNGEITADGCSRTKIYAAVSEDIVGIRLINYLDKSDWMGIIPAVSNRSDVEKLFGECEGGKSMICFYEMDSGNLIISYNSRDFCNGEPHDISKEKILSVTLMLKSDILLRNLPLDLKQFVGEQDPQIPGLQYFYYKEKTLVLNSIKESEKSEQFIYAFRFLPTPAQLKELRCEK